MPALDDVARSCLQFGLAADIEIKPSPGRETSTGQIVAREAARLWKGHKTAPLLSSFSYDALLAAKDTVPALPRGLLFKPLPAGWHEQVANPGCVSLHIDHRALDEPAAAMLKTAGLRILVYTVNDLERARTLGAWGFDAICTDRIDELTEELIASA
jgi:glycerophosphoryl diester phosphodiesterase